MIQTPSIPAASGMTLSVTSAPSRDWDEFVDGFTDRSIYLRSGWTSLAREVFRHRTYYIEARDDRGALTGVLPIVQQKGLLGNFATSIAFFNYGGALAISSEVTKALMARAQHLAQELGCSYIELRDVDVKDPTWRVRSDKVTMVLELPETEEALSKKLGSKLRSQIKRADREAVTVKHGGVELVPAFYSVFAQNMRDLGTPVYPRRFFEAAARKFPDNVVIVTIESHGVPSAAGFLVFDRQRAEIPWAACLAEAKPLGMNMKLYWEVLRLSLSRGCTSFDFGRSTVDSGTYKFKKQWGAQPVQLHWHRWEKSAQADDQSGRMMEFATALWRRLPLRVANVLGPLVSPSLPW
jgi:serine/alanine adding enzyme